MALMVGGVGPGGGMQFAGGGGAGGAGGAYGGAVGAGGAYGGPVGVGGAYGGAVGVGGARGVGGGAGASGAGCCGVDAGCGGEVQTGGAMSHVGSGGSYVLETTYKYVGQGAGSHEVVGVARTSMLPAVCGILALVVMVGLAVYFVSGGTITTTTMAVPAGPPKSCLVWGDPHIQTFDGSFPNFYAEGEFWVVKSPSVSIQARYLATPFTKGLAATHQIVVGGVFMGGSRLAVGPMDNGQITCDDKPILQEFPSSATCGPITITYNGQGNLVDDAQGHLEKKIVHIDHPQWGVHLQIMRWANHLNARITMTPRTDGQDGSCGNFNNNPNDDSTSAINMRMGGRVPQGDLLFHHTTQAAGQVIKTIADCEMNKRDHAVAVCKQAQPGSGGVLLDSCVFDVCFGGDQYAGEDGLSEGQAQ